MQRLLITPVVVQSINDALSVGICVVDNVTGLLLSFIPYLREALSNYSANVTLAVAEFTSILAVLKLNIGAEICNLTLSLAAAVFDSLNDIAVTHIHGIYNSLSRETNLAGNLLDSGLNIAATLLKSVEVNIKVLCKLADSERIALNSRLNAVSILVIASSESSASSVMALKRL